MGDSGRRLLAFLAAAIVVACTTCAYAQGRTTPVEVKNTPLVQIDKLGNSVTASQDGTWIVGIDGTASVNVANTPDVHIVNTPNVSIANSPTVKIDGITNTVKAAQSGTWNVGVTGTPAVVQSGTWTVGVSGTPNVSVVNTPSVSVSNSPTVRIDSTANVVDTPTRGHAVLLFATNQVIPNNAQVTSLAFDCSGYKELRFVIRSDWGASTLYTYVEFQSPRGPWHGTHTEYMPINPAAFTVPVFGPSCRISIINNVGATVTVSCDSWVYMVN